MNNLLKRCPVALRKDKTANSPINNPINDVINMIIPKNLVLGLTTKVNWITEQIIVQIAITKLVQNKPINTFS